MKGKTNSKKQAIALRLDANVLASLRQASAKSNVPQSKLVKAALVEYIGKQRKG